MELPINEIFSSLQGEAHWTGTPSVFVRLQFCPVGCPWCDTKHTWEKNSDREIPFDAMLKKTVDSTTWANVPTLQLLDYLLKAPEQHFVITGGEPCAYSLLELTRGLCDNDRTVQIETSGTYVIMADESTWITVSPKIDMPGGLKVLQSALYMADEIKMPVGKMEDIVRLKDLLASGNVSREPIIWLQPLSESVKATQLCIEQARINGWRVSIQTHKLIGAR